MGTTSDKLSYLSTTKDKLKTAINYTGANITNDTFRSYPEKLYNAYIDILNKGTQELFDSLPKVQETGTSITLNNTAQAPMKLDLKGNTQQDGEPTPDSPVDINVVSGDNTIEICGKNLFNPTYAVQTQVNNSEKVQTSNLYTLNQDGSISCSRYSFAQGRIYFTGLKLKAGTYYVKAHVKITNSTNNDISYSARNLHARTDIKPLATTTYSTGEGDLDFNFTLSEEVESVGISMQCNHQGTITLTNIMLCDEDIPYKTYTGQSQLIDLRIGKQLFDISKIEENTYIDENGTTGTSSVTNLSDYIRIDSNTNYTLSYDYSSLLNSSQRNFAYYSENKTFITGDVYLPTNKEHTITTPSNAKYVRFSYDKNCFDIQLESGSSATSWEAYNSIELNKISTYQDYIYKTDKWHLHKEIGKVVLDGSESWQQLAESTWGANGYYIAKPTGAMNWGRLIATYFKDANISSSRILSNGEMSITASSLVLRNNNTTTVTDFKSWLSTHNTIVYYVLATPTDTEITDTRLLEQLNNLEQIKSKKNQTNINQENNDLPFIITASALKEYE